MNNKIIENNYIVIPNFISAYKSNKLKEDFSKYAKENNLLGDSQSTNSHSFYNYISFLEMLCEKTPEVSEILEESVLPTYTYSRLYKKGSILESHVDRDACEISLTLHLGGDKSWPIYIKTPSGESKEVNLNPGDAMMYLGCEAEHWRNEYEGEEYVQVFLHYVRSRGDKVNSYFDKNNSGNNKCDQAEEKKPEEQNLKITEHEVYNPEEISRNVLATSKLEDFIEVYDNIVPDELCDLILKEFSQSNEWYSSHTSGGLHENIRNCNEIQISNESIISLNYDLRKSIDNQLFDCVANCLSQYNQKYTSSTVTNDSGYGLLRYETGQFYKQHTDSFTEMPRALSCSLNLNDDYDGGEFAFFNREVMIRAKKGSAIIFPSNFLYPHEVMPVIKGTRYSIVTWLI
jgi:Rps23 Pro-64 3,4-dihydroxylase Tpa1-like proline 4-hydroxylase